jgi:hypothetical protein
MDEGRKSDFNDRWAASKGLFSVLNSYEFDIEIVTTCEITKKLAYGLSILGLFVDCAYVQPL